MKHKPTVDGCTGCHNPHDALKPKLLRADTTPLCFGCHEKIRDIATRMDSFSIEFLSFVNRSHLRKRS